MTKDERQKLLAPESFKTAQDAEAAGRLIAQGYAFELGRLAGFPDLEKSAEEEVPPPAAEAAPKTEKTEESELGAEMESLLAELGGIL